MRARRALALALLALALGACRKGSPRLEGTWKGTRALGVDPAVQTQADRYASRVELEFKGDQVKVTTPSGSSRSKYKVVREDKGSVTIKSEADGTEESIAFESDTTIQWSVLPGKTLTFAKQ